MTNPNEKKITGMSALDMLAQASQFFDDVNEAAFERFELDVLDAGAANQDEIDQMRKDNDARFAEWKKKTLANLAAIITTAPSVPDELHIGLTTDITRAN
jgi:hypothetical protein